MREKESRVVLALDPNVILFGKLLGRREEKKKRNGFVLFPKGPD